MRITNKTFKALNIKPLKINPLLLPEPEEKKRKYSNHKVENDTGTFDSRREAKRYADLVLLEQQGFIRGLRRSVSFFFGDDERGWVKYDSGRRLYYRADFVYEERTRLYTNDINMPFIDKWQQIVEDCKGFRTDKYLIKKALMQFFHKISIRET